MVKKKKNALNTSLRSATHATDSTCKGCHPKSAATAAGRQTAPVMRRKSQKSNTVLAACSSALVAWWPAGCSPKREQSVIWESQVRGCQLAAWPVVQAQANPRQVHPSRTIGLAVT